MEDVEAEPVDSGEWWRVAYNVFELASVGEEIER